MIGSAAAALHGAAVGTIGDVDVVTGVADARRLLSAPDVVAVDAGGDGPFRSDVFARLTRLPMAVDILGGFHVRGVPLVIETRVACPVGDGVVFVPARDELVRIFRLFGRPKDLLRAAALERLSLRGPGTTWDLAPSANCSRSVGERG